MNESGLHERGRYANLTTFATNEKVRVETAKDKRNNIANEDWKERLLSQQKFKKINHQEFQLKSWTKAVCMERGRYANLSTFATNEKVRVETAKDKKSNIDKEDWKERLLSQKFTKNQSSRISVKKLNESSLHGTRPLCEFEHVCYKRKSSGWNCKG